MRNKGTMHPLTTRSPLALLAASAMASVAAGQELIKITSAEQMALLHLAMDTDHDGSLTPEEGSKFLRDMNRETGRMQAMGIMGNMDTNRDGLLSLDEFREDVKHFKTISDEKKEDFANHFPSFDDDGDGSLSLDEALPLFNYMFPFRQVDSDGDGLLTLKEFRQIAQAKLQNAPPQEIEKSEEEAKSIFAGLDFDGDGKINPKEHYVYESGLYATLTAWEALFRMSDTDEDGKVSGEDFIAVRENRQFPGSAAYHHSKEWVRRIEEVVKEVQAKKAKEKKSDEL